MRAFIIAAAFATIGITASTAYSQVNIGVSVGDGDRDGFYVAVGSYYHVPEREVYLVRDRRVREEEIPVVFYFAEMAHVRPIVIIEMRESGYTWMDIAVRFRLSPSLFYDAYNRHYIDDRSKPGRGWGRIRFADDDFIQYCNLRFLTEHYHYRAEDILRMRERHHDFYFIHNDMRRDWDRRDAREVRVNRDDRHDQREVKVEQGGRHDSHDVRVEKPESHDRSRNTDARNENGRDARNDTRNNTHRSGRERE